LTAQRKPALAAFFRERLSPDYFPRSMRRRFSSAIEFTHHRQALARGRTLKSLGTSLLTGLPFVNFPCVETLFPDYPSFSVLVLTG
jgi:hypothetical protein